MESALVSLGGKKGILMGPLEGSELDMALALTSTIPVIHFTSSLFITPASSKVIATSAGVFLFAELGVGDEVKTHLEKVIRKHHLRLAQDGTAISVFSQSALETTQAYGMVKNNLMLREALAVDFAADATAYL